MARIFYTERDIEDLARKGVKEIQVTDNVTITDTAREKMEALGIQARQSAPAPQPATITSGAAVPSAPLSDAERQQVIEKVKRGVLERLGQKADPALVDSVVRRVVGQL